MPDTFYRIEDGRGRTAGTWDATVAGRLSRAGLRVTATTAGER